MKSKMVFIVFCLIFSNNLLSQKTTLIYIKGYYIQSCAKKEILYDYNQMLMEKVAKSRNKNFVKYTRIDTDCKKYFIPIQVGDVKLDSSFIEQTIKLSDSDTIVLIDWQYRGEDGLTYFFKKHKWNISRVNLIFSESIKFSPYFYFNEIDKSDRLYKIVYVEGNAAHFKNRGKNNNPNNVSIMYLGLGDNEYTDLFFITKITNYSTIIDLPNLKVWYPYLENE
jgi:hypothetical protein